MIVNRGFKVAVCLNNKQTTLFNKSAGCARFACNWGLNRCIDEYNNNKRFITAIELHKEIVQMKKTEEFKWLKEVSKCAPQEALRDLEKRLKLIQRRVSRKFDMNKQGNKFIKTKNIVKWQKKLSKVWYRIKCLRNDYIHKATTSLVKTKPEMIVMEDLQVLNMVRNHKLSKSILDSLFGEIYRQLKYKCEWNGIKFYVADKFYPSSKTCSRCGSIKTDLKLSDRIYRCDKCGLEIDRDFNASLNLRSVGLKQLATV